MSSLLAELRKTQITDTVISSSLEESNNDDSNSYSDSESDFSESTEGSVKEPEKRNSEGVTRGFLLFLFIMFGLSMGTITFRMISNHETDRFTEDVSTCQPTCRPP